MDSPTVATWLTAHQLHRLGRTSARRSCCPAPMTGHTCRCDCYQKGVDDHCAVWLRLSFSVLGQGHLASGDDNQTGHRQRSTGDEHTQPEKAERDGRLHR